MVLVQKIVNPTTLTTLTILNDYTADLTELRETCITIGLLIDRVTVVACVWESNLRFFICRILYPDLHFILTLLWIKRLLVCVA